MRDVRKPKWYGPETRFADLCDCRDKGRKDWREHYDVTCAYRDAAVAAWEKWHKATTRWEKASVAAIREGRLSKGALEYIESRNGTGYGEISEQINYLLKLVREGK